MAKDYAEMEREFIADLKADTGRDLAEWMAVIAAQGFSNKNEAIDWLRTQGFIFNWASWLERIHANGGRPIYADKPAIGPRKKSPAAERPSAATRSAEAAVKDDDTSHMAPPTGVLPPAPNPSPPGGGGFSPGPTTPTRADPQLEELIAAAKGYQPLYRLLAAEIAKALPHVWMTAAAGYISLSRPAEFGAIETGPKGLRLALDLGDLPFEPPLRPTKLAAPPKRLSHMVVLDDARKVNAQLMELIKAADARVNPEQRLKHAANG